MKTYLINKNKYSLKPVKDLTFNEDKILRAILIDENSSFYEVDFQKVFSIILLPYGIHTADDFSSITFDLFKQIVTDYLSDRQIFFLNLPNSIAYSVEQRLRSSLNLTQNTESNVNSSQT